MTDRELMQKALGIMEWISGLESTPLVVKSEFLNALRARLAQPEQEPVAWLDFKKEAQQIVESKFLWKRFIDGTPLANDIACWMADFAQQYTTPPQREEGCAECGKQASDGWALYCVKCIETVQEPIGWIYEDDEGRMMFSQMPHPDPLWEPVYRAAQKHKLKEKNG